MLPHNETMKSILTIEEVKIGKIAVRLSFSDAPGWLGECAGPREGEEEVEEISVCRSGEEFRTVQRQQGQTELTYNSKLQIFGPSHPN